MYTTLNLIILILFYEDSSAIIRDIMRASTFLILVVVATSVWYRPLTIYKALFDSFAPPEYQLITPLYTKYGIVCIFDILFHIVPLIVIGLPNHGTSMVVACTILLVWYSIVRKRIKEIYTTGLSTDRGISIAVVTAAIGYILLEK